MAVTVIALLDDIASFTKDIAAISKVAMKKTAGVLGDDLALNAEQVTGVSAKRELPVVWAVFKGSMINKIILVPIALLLHFFLPVLMMPLLMIGGAFLAYEGIHAVMEKMADAQEKENRHQAHINAVKDENIDLVKFEKDKISSAVRTDFILSAEIIAIALSTMENLSTTKIIAGLAFTAIAITVVVYGFVALLVRLDDIGIDLMKKPGAFAKWAGEKLVNSVPLIMTGLSWFGMIALFMVGGGILLHGIPELAHAVEAIIKGFSSGITSSALILGAEMLSAAIVGLVIVGVETIIKKMRTKTPETA